MNLRPESSGPTSTTFTRRRALGLMGALALPWDTLLAQAAAGSPSTPPAPKPITPLAASNAPDLANLHSVIQWIADEQRPLHLSFLDARWRDLATWKAAARPFFRERLSYSPTPLPMQPELLRREEREGFTLEIIRISATPAYSIPARVLVPHGRKGRLPAVVALHAHSGKYVWGHETLVSSPNDSAELLAERDSAYGRPWAEHLARRGYIVIVIDAFYFGERRLRVEDLPANRLVGGTQESYRAALAAPRESAAWHAAINRTCSAYEALTAKQLFTAGATWPGVQTWDDMRSVDYLLTRPDVHPERIGGAGLSLGGLRTAHLIAADPRIKAASITGWMTQFRAQHREHLRHHTWMVYVPGAYGSMDLPDIAALHAPGALLVQQCRQDRLYPLAAMEGAVQQLTALYTKAGILERFRGTFYDLPHVFRPEMQDETFAWFDRWL